MLAFGSYDKRTQPRVGVLIEGLCAHGDVVTEVNVPFGLSAIEREAILRQAWRLPIFFVLLVRCWFKLIIRGVSAFRAARPEVVLVGYLGHFDVLLARVLFGRRATIALDHFVFAEDTSIDRGVTTTWKTRLLRLLDHLALRSADVVLLDTEEHLELMPLRHVDRAVVVPVGASYRWFQAGDERQEASNDERRAIRVVFFGLFTPLQGAPIIGEALRLLKNDNDFEFLMVGRGQDLDEARLAWADNPHVQWMEWIEADELPEVVAQHDVCLGIFSTNPKAQRVTPTKVFQGAAAGCAIVTSDTPPQRTMLNDAANYVPAGDALAIAESLRTFAEDRHLLARSRAQARDRATSVFTPEAVVIPLRESLRFQSGNRRIRSI